MDFVDEQYVALFEIGQQRREIAGLCNHGPGGGAETDAEFARHDLRQRGLAETRGAYEQHVVERLVALARGLDEHREVGARLLLADEFRQQLRAQRGVAAILGAALRRDDAGGRGHVEQIRWLFSLAPLAGRGWGEGLAPRRRRPMCAR